MTVFTSPLAATQGTGNTNVIDHGLASAGKILQTTIPVSAALALGDTILVGYVPRGATIKDAWISSAGIDTNNIAVLQLGDAVLATRIMTASGTLLGTAGESMTMAPSSYGFQYTSQTMLILTCSTAGTAKVAANIRVTVIYTVDGLPS
jgi:hypothetical protein